MASNPIRGACCAYCSPDLQCSACGCAQSGHGSENATKPATERAFFRASLRQRGNGVERSQRTHHHFLVHAHGGIGRLHAEAV